MQTKIEKGMPKDELLFVLEKIQFGFRHGWKGFTKDEKFRQVIAIANGYSWGKRIDYSNEIIAAWSQLNLWGE